VMYPRCAGLDVHKETVVACVRIVEGGDVSRSVRWPMARIATFLLDAPAR
jgi:hypothetical protein